LELLELKTVDSLVNPQNHSHAIHKKTKQIESLVTETDNDIPEGVDQFNPFTPEEMLCQVFSNIDVNRIHQVLETCNYNIEDAMDSLLNKQVEKPKQVCRHFMVGNCYRSDCWFSHDPDALLCKFWIKGRCNKGDNCEFSHGQAIELKKVEAEPIAKTPPPKMDDFPVLGQVRQKIDFLAPVNYNNVLLKPVEKTNIQKVRESQKKTKVDVQWVSTGDSLASSYFKFRGDAIDAALNRNRLFQRFFLLM
jgi:hypothetical protein